MSQNEMDLLDEDSFHITSWYECYQYAIRNNRLPEFRKKICQYIHLTNTIANKEVQEYANRRIGDFMAQKVCEKLRRPYEPR